MTAATGDRPSAPPVLAIETATTRALVALGTLDGELIAVEEWEAGHRHAEELLVRIAALLARAGVGRPGPGVLAGIVAGTGPGGFTGLRVGLATAHGIARAAAAPLVGVPTGVALAAAARETGAVPPGVEIALLLPAGPAGRYLVRDGRALLAPPAEPTDDPAPGAVLVAVDLAGRAPEEAAARGALARTGLAAALLGLGAARLREGADDGATLAPEYVTMPRGVRVATGEVAWSPARP
ncbi:MAG TPA: tRNA (adenosine(37)-N6)-threonylcarbamoyltransferase complex dimerization subunit type 1 TsaB [Candidatus Nanopelagicales bacterium]|nr:tRNA (adenosine(37)-N6)-threonylcarbamoyltransferase complex dimerization subunit type 1 TsaB [Candidatus Nanopelagicales bacterium]